MESMEREHRLVRCLDIFYCRWVMGIVAIGAGFRAQVDGQQRFAKRVHTKAHLHAHDVPGFLLSPWRCAGRALALA
jgi:hypothetical protein